MPSVFYKKESTWTEMQFAQFPVGSIFMSYESTSPSSFIGGTWTQIKDTFLLAAGSTYSAKSTGGEATHTLTIDEMPSHNHSGSISGGEDTGWPGTHVVYTDRGSRLISFTTSFTGGTQSHNNMPPYLAVYIWRRTA